MKITRRHMRQIIREEMRKTFLFEQAEPVDPELVSLIVQFISVLDDSIGGEKRKDFLTSIRGGGPVFRIINSVVKGALVVAKKGAEQAQHIATSVQDAAATSESAGDWSDSRETILEIGERLNWIKLIGDGTIQTLKTLGKKIAFNTLSVAEFEEALAAAGKQVDPPLDPATQAHIGGVIAKFEEIYKGYQRADLINEADSDGDGRSDKQELEDIAAGMEETQKRSWDLSEEELRNMSQEEYTNLLRAEADAAMAEDPGLSMSVVAEYDPTRPYFTEYENALEMERSLLSDAIEDVIQSYWGFKPRNYEKYRTMNLQQLRDLYEKEIQRASEHIEDEEGWEKDIEDERHDQMQADLDVANIAAAEAAAEEERMRTPEEGEELPGQIGMGRGRMMEESFTRGDIKNFFARGLLTEDVT